ncbi:MAG: 50S ribosome-binding GTPase [Chloroflexota bacterium]|nr:50S ribosome-binding GTPase [Chloroflexota bacterium]
MAKKKRIILVVDDEQQKKLKKNAVDSILRKTNRAQSARSIGANALKNLPGSISVVQAFMKAVNWQQAQNEVLDGLNNTVVIVGQPNSGKSTLFNTLKGQNLSPVSPQAGTTKTLVRTDFGPFTLVDTPGHLPNVMESGMDQASVIVFLIDGSRGLQTEDRDLYNVIKGLKKPTIIAVNKVDTLKGGESADQFATEVAVLLGAVGVIPISGKTGMNVTSELIPSIIEASPEAALAIGRELPAFRRTAAQKIIRNAALLSLAAGLEPIPFIDIPIILGTQARLVLRLAALYGEPMDSSDARKHARELIVAMIGGLGMRYVAEQVAKLVPFGGDFVAGAIAAASTWSIGEVALEYYEGGKQIQPGRLQQLYLDFYHRFRKENKVQELRSELAAQNTTASIPSLTTPKEDIFPAKVLEEGTAS